MVEFKTEKFTALRYKHESLMTYGDIIVGRELDYKTRREILLLTKSAKERYLEFSVMYPGLENYISQYHIASYFSVIPISLSRIRLNVARN